MAVEEEIDSALSDRKGSKCDAVLSYLNSLNEEETFSLCILGRLGIHGTDMKTGYLSGVWSFLLSLGFQGPYSGS